MKQGYTLRLNRGPDMPPLLYHGNVYADGESVDTRTEDELSGRAYVNRRFQAALDEYGRHAFEIIWTPNYESDHDAILCERDRIARDDTTHPDKGLNVEPWDKKRWKKALAEHTPGASQRDLFAAAMVDFRNNNGDTWAPFDLPENEILLFETAVKEACSVTTAFHIVIEAGTLTKLVTKDDA